VSPGSTPSGLHVRAGNAMGRTRDGLLDGALASIERDGLRHTTMAGIAERSGVAKATLYNHFRTKPDVLAALVAREVDRVADLAGDTSRHHGLAAALDQAAGELAGMVAARQVAVAEPEALLPLLAPGDGAGWEHARQRAAQVLENPAASPLVDLVLRWLAGQLLAAQPPDLRNATAVLLAGAGSAVAATAGTPGTST
jgi:AcrR family transcriptional regulator